MIETMAVRLTGGNKTEAVARALRALEARDTRKGSLFAAHRGSVKVAEGVDLIAPIFDDEPDTETGAEIAR